MVVFGEEVRNELLVSEPEKRGLFTATQCELVNGLPLDDGDQDSLEEVLTISQDEFKYWEKRGLDPYYMYENASEDWEQFI